MGGVFTGSGGSGKPEKQSIPLLLTAALAAGLPLIYYGLIAPRRNKPYPPGPPGLPILGNLLQLPSPNGEQLLDDKLLEWAKEYGLVYSIKLFGLGTWVVISDPDLVQRIYVTKNYPKSFMYQIFAPVVGVKSLLLAPKDEWISKRKAFMPGFSPKFLKDMVHIMVEKLDRFEKCIDQDIAAKEPTNMLQRTQTFTSDVIVAVAFGEDWGGDVDTQHPARVWNNEIAQLLGGTITSPMKKFFGFRLHRQIRKYEKLIDDEMMRILERR